jgi:hypothetical protein
MPTNVNCRGFIKIPGFDIENFPFVTARSQSTFQLVNVNNGFCQNLITDKCDSNWY